MHLSSPVSTAPTPAKSGGFNWRAGQNLSIYLMLVPALILLFLFTYYPMYGLVIAFKRYDPLVGFAASPWVGFQNFQRLFKMHDFWEILRNTLFIATGKIIFGQFAAIVFAILLNEVKFSAYKRFVQTLTYLPYFLSWMVFAGILKDVLQLDGVVNHMASAIGLGRINYLGDPDLFQWTMIFTDVWKGFGYGAIIYLAALTGVDPALFEAAAVDGANRWQRIWNVTLPGIAPAIIIMVTLNLGWVLSAGFEQILVMYNPAVYATGDIIDTYVYRVGLLGSQFSLGTTVGLFKSVVGFGLITLAYYLARRFANYRMF